MDCPDLCKKIPDSTEVVDVQAEDGQDQNGNEPGTDSEAEDSVDEDDVPVSGMEAKAAIDLLRKYLSKGKYTSQDVDLMMLGEIDFGDMIAQHVTHTGIEPTQHMPYPELTVVFFVVLIALGSNQ